MGGERASGSAAKRIAAGISASTVSLKRVGAKWTVGAAAGACMELAWADKTQKAQPGCSRRSA